MFLPSHRVQLIKSDGARCVCRCVPPSCWFSLAHTTSLIGFESFGIVDLEFFGSLMGTLLASIILKWKTFGDQISFQFVQFGHINLEGSNLCSYSTDQLSSSVVQRCWRSIFRQRGFVTFNERLIISIQHASFKIFHYFSHDVWYAWRVRSKLCKLVTYAVMHPKLFTIIIFDN